MTGQPTLYGACYSVYVRIVRLVLSEKGVNYHLVPIDIFAKEKVSSDHLIRHPFGRIPAFEYAGFSLYETGVITRYIDEAFDGPKLQPTNLEERAKCNQLISIADNYAYPLLVWDIYVEQVLKPGRGEAVDEEKIVVAIPKTRICLKAISDLMDNNLWLTGTELTLADLFLGPNIRLFSNVSRG